MASDAAIISMESTMPNVAFAFGAHGACCHSIHDHGA